MSRPYDIPSLIRGRIFMELDPNPKELSKKQLRRALLLSNVGWFLGLCLAFLAIHVVVSWYFEQRALKHAEMEHSRTLETEVVRLANINSFSTSQTMETAEKIQSVLDTAKGKKRTFLEGIIPHALRMQALYRIPASATIGMSIYESGYGSSKLAQHHNNFFGIKAFGDWQGQRTNMPTVDLGVPTRANFRVYGSIEDGIRGYADFLHKRSRYREAFQFSEGPQFVAAVAAAGYCPDSDYAEMVAKIIGRHNLEVLDVAPEVPSMANGAMARTGIAQLIEWPVLDLSHLVRPERADTVMNRPARKQIAYSTDLPLKTGNPG